MKVIAIILSIVGCAFAASAQTNEALIPILTAGTQSFTNARITHVTPAYAVVSYDGGIAQVALSNLPTAYQRQYDYDPTNAAKYLEDKKQEQLQARARLQAQRAAYQRYVASLAGTNQPVRIVSINAEAPYLKCTAETKSGTRDINLKNLPDPVRNFITRLNQLRGEVASFEDRVDDYTRAARHADALAPTTPILTTGGNSGDANSPVNQRAQANLMLNRAEDMQKQLVKMKEDLAAMESESVKNTTVLAYPTGQIYDQLEIWVCTGVAGNL
ncbi:MAG TPA: hypothetical protein VMB80_11135 [Candidatus Acidoferrum sp.]|nr:hypothetical protein [Candidatus Acidoferrum sp.]